MSATDVINQVLSLPNEAKLIILAPLINRKKGSFADLLENLRSKGYVRAMIDGVMVRLDEDIELSKTQMHTIKVVIDRVTANETNKDRIAQDVEKGLKESFGELEIEIINHEELVLKPQLLRLELFAQKYRHYEHFQKHIKPNQQHLLKSS